MITSLVITLFCVVIIPFFLKQPILPNATASEWTAKSLSPQNGGNVALLLGTGVAMKCSIGFHFLSI